MDGAEYPVRQPPSLGRGEASLDAVEPICPVPRKPINASGAWIPKGIKGHFE